MSARLRVGDRAIARTGDNLDGLIVSVTRVLDEGYHAVLGLESAEYFAEGELELLPAETPARRGTTALVALLVVAVVLALGLLSVWGAR